MEYKELLLEGSDKQAFSTDDENVVLIRFKDEATAYHKIKRAIIRDKGVYNNKISAILFGYLHEAGVKTHFLKVEGEREQLCRKVEMIPLEVICRNYMAGSFTKRLDLKEGTKCPNTVLEYRYKNSRLDDPFINGTVAEAIGLVNHAEMEEIRDTTLRINEIASSVLSKAGITLIDFKIEYGRTADGQVVLADEISPDTSRMWDSTTGDKLDKDRFRRDLDRVIEGYSEIYNRLNNLNK